MRQHLKSLVRALAVCILFAALQVAAQAAQCPQQIDSNDCVANDLQPTGTEIIEGPTHCTEGEIISATVRVLFENGGGANERFSVGFFFGNDGEPAVGGTSCTFDSLQPIDIEVDLTSGVGGFLELNGDQCGDISGSDPTYKDIQLDNLMCRDADGDGPGRRRGGVIVGKQWQPGELHRSPG